MEVKKEDKNNVIERIGERFSKEIEEIKKIRLENNIDKKKKSTRQLTNLIIHHKYWKIIKKEMCEINLEEKKKYG